MIADCQAVLASSFTENGGEKKQLHSFFFGGPMLEDEDDGTSRSLVRPDMATALVN